MLYKQNYMKIKFNLRSFYRIFLLFIFSGFLLSGCNGKFGADARKFPDDPKLRVKKNLEEGRGVKIDNILKSTKEGVFEIASTNEYEA